MSNKYQLGYPEDRGGLSDEDVVSNSGGLCFGTPDMAKLKGLIERIRSWACGTGRYPSAEYKWFTEEGFKCEVLRVNGGGWIKGRFRFRLEFVPDEPEAIQPKDPSSPLADLRSQLDTQ
ncbi:KGK domain-containing protein [Nostoc sp. PA-18-2419]|uniref:KGK domain-containing protein n=1 Tax=Nostoc sp. PA-18-2419 TaxID=2575443 RepID=UPI001CB9CC1B|nr:KGK domain-containing protein [Nostoc sp. PA-18-2419]